MASLHGSHQSSPECHKTLYLAHYSFGVCRWSSAALIIPWRPDGYFMQMIYYSFEQLVEMRTSFDHLQHDISLIENWVKCNHLTLNSTKCKYMVISRKRNPSLPQTLTLGGSDLERVECFKYLGLLLSANLSFSEHIQSMCMKAKKILGLL